MKTRFFPVVSTAPSTRAVLHSRNGVRRKFPARALALAAALALLLPALPAAAQDKADKSPVIYTTFNTSGVRNGPRRYPEYRNDGGNVLLTSVTTYHWNDGQGAAAGSIGIYDKDTGECLGTWPVSTRFNNTWWDAFPRIVLERGKTYYFVDSDQASWSYNNGSGFAGFIELCGVPAPAPAPAPVAAAPAPAVAAPVPLPAPASVPAVAEPVPAPAPDPAPAPAVAVAEAPATGPEAPGDEIDEPVAMLTANNGRTSAGEWATQQRPEVPEEEGKEEDEVAWTAYDSDVYTSPGETPEDEVMVEEGDFEFDDADFEFTYEDAIAAAEAATPEDYMPTEQELREMEEAFARLPKLPRLPENPKATVAAPCIPDEFLNRATFHAAIANLREVLRELTGPMEAETEKRFNETFDAAIDYPCDEVVEWCKLAAPLLTELAQLKAGVCQGIVDYDETLDESYLARKVGNYEAAHGLLRELGYITAGLKAKQARMDELWQQFSALGPMPDAAAIKKADAEDYEAAKRTVREYLVLGGEVEDLSIEGEWVRDGRHVEYVWDDSRPPEADQGDWNLEMKTKGGLLGAELFEQPKLVITPITQFATNGLVYAYVYGEGFTAYMRTFKKERDESLDTTDCRDIWFEPDGKGGFSEYTSKTNETGQICRVARTRLEPCKDDDGKAALLVMKHVIDFAPGEDGAPASTTHRYETAVYRPTDATYYSLHESDDSAEGSATGKTAEEKKKAAERSFNEASARHNLLKDLFGQAAGNAPFEDAPPPYRLYYVLAEQGQRNPDKYTLGNALEAAVGSGVPGFGYLWNYSAEIERIDPEPTVQETRDGIYEVDVTRDDDGGPQPSGPKESLTVTDHSNANCFDQAMDYRVFFTSRQGEKIELDFAEGSFLAEWKHPTTVLRAWDDDTCRLKIWPKVEGKPCRFQDSFRATNTVLGIVFGNIGYGEFHRQQAKRIGGILSGNSQDEAILMGCTNAVVTAESGNPVELAVNIGTTLPKNLEICLDIMPKMAWQEGNPLGFVFRYVLVPMDAAKAREVANTLDAKWLEEAKAAWKEIPDEGLATVEPEKPRRPGETEEEATVREETLAFHRENIKFIEGNIERLRKQMAEAKDESQRKSIEWEIVCQQSNKIHEEDLIRAVETGVFQASRTPFDDMCQAQVVESCMNEVESLARADRARKFLEQAAEKETDPERRSIILNRIARQLDESPDDPAPLESLRDYLVQEHMAGLEQEQVMAHAEGADLDTQIQALEYLRTAGEFSLMVTCGGPGLGVAKWVGVGGMFLIGYSEGGVATGAEKSLRIMHSAIDIGIETFYGYCEEGAAGAAKRGEIAFALHYGIPYLCGKLKGPPDMSIGDAMNPDRMLKYISTPKLATRRPPKISLVNQVDFEMKYADHKLNQMFEKQKKFDLLTKKNPLDPRYTEKGIKVKMVLTPEQKLAEQELKQAIGAVNELPLAKAKLKYDPKLSTSAATARYANMVGKMQEETIVEMKNIMAAKGYNAHEFKSFRNGFSTDASMDWDVGLTPKSETVGFTRNGKEVPRAKYMADAQAAAEEGWFKTSGHNGQKSFINATHSMHPEAYDNLGVLKASGKAKKMMNACRKMTRGEVRQMMDVTKFKAQEMAAIKTHPKFMGEYEMLRGTWKDFDSKVLKTLEGEIDVLAKAERSLTLQGKALAKGDAIKLEKLQGAYSRFSKFSKACERVGKLEVPLYEANEYVRLACGGKDVTEVIDDASQLLEALNLHNAAKAKMSRRVFVK